MSSDRCAPSGPVDDRDVRVFLAVANELHIGRAAAVLDLTASRVSQVISRLEHRVGGRLLDRSSRRTTLTALGQRFRDAAAPAMCALDRAIDEIRTVAGGIAGELVIGTYDPLMSWPVLSALTGGFEREFPNASVRIRDVGEFGGETVSLLRRGEIDVATVRLPLSDRDIVIGPELRSEPRVALMAAGHPLASSSQLTWEQLADYPVTDHDRYPREAIDAFIPPRTPSGRLLTRRVVRSTADVFRHLRTSELIHPTVPSLVEWSASTDLVSRPIVDLPDSVVTLGWLESRNDDTMIQALAEVLTAIRSEHSDQEAPRADCDRAVGARGLASSGLVG